MTWQIKFHPAAEHELDKIDPQTVRSVLAFLRGQVAKLDDPRSIGEALKGSKVGAFWKYCVGEWRIIAHIEDGALRILAVRTNNRRKVYQK